MSITQIWRAFRAAIGWRKQPRPTASGPKLWPLSNGEPTPYDHYFE